MVWKTGRQSLGEQLHGWLGSWSQPLANWYVLVPDSLNSQRQLLTKCINIWSRLPKANCGLCHCFDWALLLAHLVLLVQRMRGFTARRVWACPSHQQFWSFKSRRVHLMIHAINRSFACCWQPLRWNPSFFFAFLSPCTCSPKSWLCESRTLVCAGRKEYFVVSCGACLKLSPAPCPSPLHQACSVQWKCLIYSCCYPCRDLPGHLWALLWSSASKQSLDL